MVNKFLFTLLISLVSLSLFSQPDYEKAFLKEYERRISKEYLDDVYIPADLEDAIEQIKKLADPDIVAEFKAAPEDTIAVKLHFGLGKWMMINWGFYEGSRLSHHLKLKGVSFPDDMAQLIIISFHRHLNGVPLDTETLAKAYAEKRYLEQQKRITKIDTIVKKRN